VSGWKILALQEFNYGAMTSAPPAALKPPSLKEQALALIDDCADPEGDYLDDNALYIIHRALEALPDD
jgi:hypothetical protein